MEVMSSNQFVIQKPISIWSRDVNLSTKSFFSKLTKAITNGAQGDFDKCFDNLIDSIVDVKVNDKLGQLAWALIHEALQQSTSNLINECLDLLNYSSSTHLKLIEHKFDNLLKEMFDTELLVTPDLITHPEKLPLVASFCTLIEVFCIELGAKEVDSKAIASKLPNKFGTSIYQIWFNNSEKFKPLIDVLDSSLSKKSLEYLNWKIYHQSLHLSIEKRVFKESFGLNDIYVYPRAFYCALENTDIQLESSSREPIKYIIDLKEYVTDWVLSTKTSDNLKFISGEPGSGKSSFSKIFASHIAKNTGYQVLLIPLHFIDMDKDLDEAIVGYCNVHPSLKGVDIKSINKLLIIFDGLDEISMQGKVGEAVSSVFISQLKIKSELEASVQSHIKLIVTGRDLAIQACEAFIKDTNKYINILPYYMPPLSYEFDDDKCQDPKGLLDIDQRDIWWKKFAGLKNKSWEGIPADVDTNELEPINSQPLLNYLLALSLLRGKINFKEGPSLNTIYHDLLENVFDRQYASESGEKSQTHNSIMKLTKDNFSILMQEVALAVWHCNGTTATEKYIYKHLQDNELEHLLESFTQESEQGVSNLLLSFYFRKFGQTEKGESTFEFTHKSFGEYLTSKKLVNLVIELSDSYHEKKLNYRKGKKLDNIIYELINALGAAKFETYFHKFVYNEFSGAGLSKDGLMNVLELLDKIITHTIQNNFALERVSNLTFNQMTKYADNLNLALMGLRSILTKVIFEDEPKIQYEINSRKFSSYLENWLEKNLGNRHFIDYLNHMNLSHIDLYFSNFTICNLEYSNLSSSDLYKVGFLESNLEGLDLSSSLVGECNFVDSDLDYSCLTGSQITGCNFTNSLMNFCESQDVLIRNSVFVGCTLTNSDFLRSSFADCNFEGADFTNSNLENTIFHNCNLKNAILVGANLKGCNLKEADLTGVDFKDVDVSRCILPMVVSNALPNK